MRSVNRKFSPLDFELRSFVLSSNRLTTVPRPLSVNHNYAHGRDITILEIEAEYADYSYVIRS